jgi:hypothetical protein
MVIHFCADFISYWLHCFWIGATYGDGVFSLVELVCALLWCFCKRKGDTESSRNEREEKVREIGKWCFIGVLAFSTIFVAPFVQHQDSDVLSGEIIKLGNETNNLQKTIDQKDAEITALKDFHEILKGGPIEQPTPTDNAAILKPLPDKIIAFQSPPMETVPIFQVETDLPDTNDIGYEFEQERARYRKGVEDQKAQTIAAWTNSFPAFKYVVKTLRDILSSLAIKRNDGLVITSNYNECLPSTINPLFGGGKVAEIRFYKQTNMDFTITITTNQLRIDCSCGYITFSTANNNNVYFYLKIPDDTSMNMGMLENGDHTAIDKKLRLLIGAQFYSVLPTNN